MINEDNDDKTVFSSRLRQPSPADNRSRLIEAEVIESPRKGELAFAVPHLAEYLRNRA